MEARHYKHGHLESYTRKLQFHTLQETTGPFSANHWGKESNKRGDEHLCSEVGVT